MFNFLKIKLLNVRSKVVLFLYIIHLFRNVTLLHKHKYIPRTSINLILNKLKMRKLSLFLLKHRITLNEGKIVRNFVIDLFPLKHRITIKLIPFFIPDVVFFAYVILLKFLFLFISLFWILWRQIYSKGLLYPRLQNLERFLVGS